MNDRHNFRIVWVSPRAWPPSLRLRLRYQKVGCESDGGRFSRLWLPDFQFLQLKGGGRPMQCDEMQGA